MQTASLFNGGLFKNLVKRYWPLWLIWLCAWLLTYVAPLYSFVSAAAEPGLDLANTMESQVNIWNMASFVVLFNVFLAAIIVAVFLNERLFSTRAATFYGSLPAKRDAVFVTTYLAGFLPLVAVEAIVAVVLLPLAAANPGITFGMVGAWLALAVAFTFILYSLAVLLCQITGTRAVAVFLYLLVNVLAVCIEMAIRFIVSAFVWGVSSDELRFDWLAPFVCLARNCVWVDATNSGVNWLVLGLYSLAAVGFLALALWLGRKRGYEHAGDPIAFVRLRPAMKYLAGICGALLLESFTYLMLMATRGDLVQVGASGAVLFAVVMAVGAVLGVLFAQMVLARSTRVFKDVWKGALVLSCASVLLVGACYFDVMGVATYVPATSQVEKAVLVSDGTQVELASEEGIESIRALHGQIVEHERLLGGLTDADNAGRGGDPLSSSTTIVYEMKDGDIVQRDYDVRFFYDAETGKRMPGPGADIAEAAEKITNSVEGKRWRLAEALDPQSGCKYVFTIGTDAYNIGLGEEEITLTGSQAKSFIEEAFEPDMLEGTAGDTDAQRMWGDPSPTELNASMIIEAEDGRLLCQYWLDTQTTPHTVAWLKEHYAELNSTGGELVLQPASVSQK